MTVTGSNLRYKDKMTFRKVQEEIAGSKQNWPSQPDFEEYTQSLLASIFWN